MPAVSTSISTNIPADLADRFAEVARQTGRTQEEALRIALLDHIEDMEDLIVASQRSSDLKAGRSHTRPLEEVIRELCLED